jgi:hypothetical protein
VGLISPSRPAIDSLEDCISSVAGGSPYKRCCPVTPGNFLCRLVCLLLPLFKFYFLHLAWAGGLGRCIVVAPLILP